MRADYSVVIDACVLANYGVANLLLLLAEKPRLFSPVWSDTILRETRRTQIDALRWDRSLANRFHTELTKHFPEAMATGFEYLIPQCHNDTKDRHVLACAIHSNAETILTFNLKDFPGSVLDPWGIVAKHPQDYLLTLFSMEPVHVMHQLANIAQKRNCTIEDHLIDLGRFLPSFSRRVSRAQKPRSTSFIDDLFRRPRPRPANQTSPFDCWAAHAGRTH